MHFIYLIQTFLDWVACSVAITDLPQGPVEKKKYHKETEPTGKINKPKISQLTNITATSKHLDRLRHTLYFHNLYDTESKPHRQPLQCNYIVQLNK